MKSRLAALGRVLALVFVAAGVVGAFAVSDAHADKVHKKFKGKIILSLSPFPAGFDSDGDMIRYLKKVKEDEFIKNKKGNWTFEYMAFLKEKFNQKTAVIVFYDVTERGYEPVEVTSEGLTPEDPYAKIFAGYITLSSEFFQAEHRYQMHIKRGRHSKPLAQAEFVLRD